MFTLTTARNLTRQIKPTLAAVQMTNCSPMTSVSRCFVHTMSRNKTGLEPREFDYNFEKKIDHGRFPYNHQSYMKILGESYDTNSA